MAKVSRKASMLAVSVFSLVSSAQIFAQEVATEASAEVTPQVGKHIASSGMDVMSMSISLFLVIGLIIVSAFVLKKFQLGNQSQQGLKIISSLHLGTKERIVVVEVNNKQLLLGVTAQQINVLDTLTEPLVQNQPLSMEMGQQLMKAFKK